MSDDALHEQIAEYLGGEMTAADRSAFERRMQSDAQLREQVEALRHALAGVEDLAPAPVRLATSAPAYDRPVLARIGLAARIAAAACVAFVMGYAVRDWTAPQPAPVGSARITPTPATVESPIPADARVIEAFQTARTDSYFGKALVALSQKH